MANTLSTKHDPSVPLSQAIKEIDLVLAYSARKGLNVDKEIIDVLVQAKDAIAAGGDRLEPDIESKLWAAYMELTRLIQPVSIGGIQASSDTHGKLVWTLRGRRLMSKASIAARHYHMISIASLIVLLFLQLYAGIGATILNGLEGVEHNIRDKEQEIKELSNKQLRLDVDPEKIQEIIKKQYYAKKELEFLSKDLKARFRLLNVWNLYPWLKKPDPEVDPDFGEEDDDLTADQIAPTIESSDASGESTPGSAETIGEIDEEMASTEHDSQEEAQSKIGELLTERVDPGVFGKGRIQAKSRPPDKDEGPKSSDDQFWQHIVLAGRITVEALNVYFLPLFYGLLGACAFVLRSLSTNIRKYTYSPESDIGLKLRLYLGALSGFAIAWFINDATTPGLAESITPFALAFLAGYSVEVVFTAMDRLISAFSREQPQSERS